MSRDVKAQGGRRGQRGTLVWVTGAVAFVATLLYWEQAALLYVFSTLAVCGLLLVVAFSDLEGRDKELAEAARREKSAPAGGELTAATDPRPKRRAAKRRRHEAALKDHPAE